MRNFLFTKIQKKIGIPVRFTSLTKLFLHVKVIHTEYYGSTDFE